MGKLVYFDLHGRAAAIRMLLAHAEVEFEDERVSFEQWGELKAAGKYKGLPVWEENDKCFNESKALLRFLGTRHGYYPEDVNVAWQCDALVDYFPSAFEKFNKHYLAGVFPDEALDEFKEACDKMMEKCETMQTSHGHKFLVRDKISICDFMIFANIASWFLNDAFMFKDQFAPIFEELKEDRKMFFKWIEYMTVEAAKHLESREAKPF